VITALLLAAGSARRFGGPKLTQELGGRAVVRWVADALLAADIDALTVVVPAEYGSLSAALEGTDAAFVVNPDPERGIGASIATGVAAMSDDVGACLVALADEPALDPAVVRRVVETYRAHRADARSAIVAPRYGTVPGHPVLFDRSVFPELRALAGDRGARAVIDRDPVRVTIVEVHATPPGDVDTPEDLARLRRERQNMSRLPTSPNDT
jgi:molybdenum cofactor cytidylyltransferase